MSAQNCKESSLRSDLALSLEMGITAFAYMKGKATLANKCDKEKLTCGKRGRQLVE